MHPTSERPLRLLVLYEFFYPDNVGAGIAAVSAVLTRLQNRLNVDVTILPSRNSYSEPEIRYEHRDEWKGITIMRVAGPNWKYGGLAKRFVGNLIYTFAAAAKAMTLPRPDVVLVVSQPFPLPIAAKIVKRLRGVPYTYLMFDLDPDRTVALGIQSEDSRSIRLMRRWQRAWLHGATRVVAIGRCMKAVLVGAYGLPSERVDVVEVGADPDVIRVLPKETEFRRRNALEGFVVLYSGNFGRYHDFDTLLGAARLLKEKGSPVTFVLAGSGHRKPQVAQIVEREGLTNVRLFPFVPEEQYADLVASADVCVVTLEAGMEGLCVPSKFYSLLGAGRPVIALMRPEGEVAVAIQEADCGLRFDLGDAVGLAKALEAMVANPSAPEAQGANARRAFDDLYSSDWIAEKLRATLIACAEAGLVPEGPGPKPRFLSP